MPTNNPKDSHYRQLPCGAGHPLWNRGVSGSQRRACWVGVRSGMGLQRLKTEKICVKVRLFYSTWHFLQFFCFWNNSLVSLGFGFIRAWEWLGPRWTLSVTFQRTTSVPLGGPVLTIGVSRWSEVSRDWRSKYSSSLNPTMRPENRIQHKVAHLQHKPLLEMMNNIQRDKHLTSPTARQQSQTALRWEKTETITSPVTYMEN